MVSDWLTQALKKSRISQAELARQLTIALKRSIDRAAVNKMVSGKRDISADEMIEIAKITAYPFPMEPESRFVRLAGYVDAGSIMRMFSEGDAPAKFVRGYDGQTEKTVAVEIRAGCLGSVLDGWFAYFDAIFPEVTPDMYGQLCVVWLDDGRVLLKVVVPGTIDRKHTLTSNFEPPLYDVTITNIARIKHLQPSPPA